MKFSEKLLKLREILSLNQTEMAAKLGLSMNYISSLERGNKEPSDAVRNHVDLLEQAVEAGYYYSGSNAMKEDMDTYNSSQKPSSYEFPKLISSNDIGNHINGYSVNSEDDLCHLHHDDNCFALRLSGDSMAPNFGHGTLLVISPSITAQSGQLVLLKLKSFDDCLFRRIEYEKDKIICVPDNTRYTVQIYERNEVEWIYPVSATINKIIK